MVSDQIGDAQQIYLPFILSLFTLILTINLIGNIPYSYSVFTSAIIAMSMSVSIFLAVTIIGIVIHKVHWFSFFVPGGTPLALVPLLVLIETISYLARAVSLGVRIFSNMTAGKVLAHILAGGLYSFFTKGVLVAVLALVPLTIFLAVLGLELAVGLIQAYVFTILTCSYINDAIKLH
jgi:F-type H+-transporting ATPase subunit a